MTSCGYIHDGYTTNFFIAEVEGLHPSLKGRYRPMLAQNRAVVIDRMERSGAAKGEGVAAATIAAQVDSWDLKNEKGEWVTLSEASALRLQPILMTKLLGIVMGNRPSDANPDSSPEDLAADADTELQAALAGRSPEEADEKN